MTKGEQIIEGYKEAYKSLHGVDIKVTKQGNRYKIGLGIGTTYRLDDIKQLTRNLIARLACS